MLGRFSSADRARLIRILSGSGLLTLANVASALATVAVIPLLIHGVGLAGYGVLTLAQVFALTVIRFSDFQSWQVYTRVATGASEGGASSADAWRTALPLDALAFLGLLLASLIAPAFMAFWSPESMPALAVLLFAFSGVQQITFSWIGRLRLEGRFFTLALLAVVPSVLRLVLLLVWKFAGWPLDLVTAAWLFTLPEIVRLIWGAWVGLRGAKVLAAWREGRWRKAEFKSFAFWLWATNLVDLPIQYVDQLLVGRLLSVEAAGAYGAIKKLGGAIGLLANPVSQVIFPEFTRLVGDGQLRRAWSLMWKAFWLIAVPGVLGTGLLYALRGLWFNRFGLTDAYLAECFLFIALQVFGIGLVALHPLAAAINLMRPVFWLALAGNILFCALATVLTLHWALLGLIAALVVQNVLVLGGKLALVNRRLPQ